ncbi:MAG: ribosomal L7Ae/L30e/S12e/Gadd45 family protein [Oscillospiraceae bacterium]|jgi:ribosomal protein L7Ae-like RNA K-turn-binding protein|nr:ribosomal L7Ae/L30e/S12e/Gadd45 family protein [Oscillospiraceae bacterium]
MTKIIKSPLKISLPSLTTIPSEEIIVNVKLFSFLGIALKADKLSLGFDPAIISFKSCSAKLVLVTSDLSPKTLKKLSNYANNYKIEIIKLKETMHSTLHYLGKKSGIITLKDRGFTEEVRKLIKG